MTSIPSPLGVLATAPFKGVLPMNVQPTALFTWKPSDEILHLLPDDFSIKFFCCVDKNIRRFTPVLPLPHFTSQAFLAGLAILLQRNGFNPHMRSSYSTMHLLFQLATKLREHLDRRFVRREDFAASRRGEDVLPGHVGKTCAGEGNRWTVQQLEQEGRDAAREKGTTPTKRKTVFHFGLLEAARRNPWDLTSLDEEEARKLVRFALFDLGPAPGEADAAKTEEVIGRIVDALEKHQDYDNEEFNRWFFDQLDNLVHQVSKRKTGGIISRKVVRQALLEEVFRSFTYVGDCVHLLMLDVREALSDPLNERELAIFRFLYLKQRFFGGLPLVLLQDRFEFLDEAIQTLVDSAPDRNNIGTLLRLLEYYGAMVSNKRQVDREHKRRARHRNKSGGIAKEIPVQDWDSPTTPDADSCHEEDPGEARNPAAIQPSASKEQFEEFAEAIRKKRKVQCKCSNTDHWRATVIRQDNREVVLADGCEACDHEALEYRVSIEELKAIAKKISVQRKAR